MTMKDDIAAVRDMAEKLESDGLWSDADAAERVIALAERAANPWALAALLDACEAVPLINHPDGYVMLGYSADALAGLARAIDHWRAAKAEGLLSKCGAPLSHGHTCNLPAGHSGRHEWSGDNER